jgi:hypothetical protein
LIPAEIRVFATSQTAKALDWITDAAVRKRPPVAAPAIGVVSGRSRPFRPPVQYLHRAL